MLGAYSSEAMAEAACARFVEHPKIAPFPKGFRIDTGILGPGSEAWTTGFVRMDEL